MSQVGREPLPPSRRSVTECGPHASWFLLTRKSPESRVLSPSFNSTPGTMRSPSSVKGDLGGPLQQPVSVHSQTPRCTHRHVLCTPALVTGSSRQCQRVNSARRTTRGRELRGREKIHLRVLQEFLSSEPPTFSVWSPLLLSLAQTDTPDQRAGYPHSQRMVQQHVQIHTSTYLIAHLHTDNSPFAHTLVRTYTIYAHVCTHNTHVPIETQHIAPDTQPALTSTRAHRQRGWSQVSEKISEA